MIENVGERTGLVIAGVLCLCGFLTLFWMFNYAFFRRRHQSSAKTMLVFFGAVGLLIPAGIGVVSLTNRVLPDLIYSVWPTSFLLGAGENGDPVWYIVLVFGAAILSNVGLYGFVGLLVGGAWTLIRRARLTS